MDTLKWFYLFIITITLSSRPMLCGRSKSKKDGSRGEEDEDDDNSNYDASLIADETCPFCFFGRMPFLKRKKPGTELDAVEVEELLARSKTVIRQQLFNNSYIA